VIRAQARAERALRRFLRRWRFRRQPTRDACDYWHIGHPPDPGPIQSRNPAPRNIEIAPVATTHTAATRSAVRRADNVRNDPLHPVAINSGAVPAPKMAIRSTPCHKLLVLAASARNPYTSPHGRNPVNTPAKKALRRLGPRR
jgi:hypothetical protein